MDEFKDGLTDEEIVEVCELIFDSLEYQSNLNANEQEQKGKNYGE